MRFDALKAIKEKKGLRSEKDCTETRSHRYPARATVVTQIQGSLGWTQIFSEHWLLVMFPAVWHIRISGPSVHEPRRSDWFLHVIIVT